MDERKNTKRRFPESEYKGVIYEPSYGAGKPPVRKEPQRAAAPRTHTSAASNHPATHIKRKRKNQKNQKSQFAAFYIITLFTGVIIVIITFAVMFNSFSSRRATAQATKAPSAINSNSNVPPPEPAIKEINQIVGLVRELNVGLRQAKIMDVTNKKIHILSIEGATELKNKYGQSIVLSEISAGCIVDASFDVKTGTLTNMTISPKSWEVKTSRNIKINHEDKTISHGNNVYSYDDDVLTSYKSTPYDINKITSKDLITITGYDDNVWYVQLDKGHGSINVINYSNILSGVLEINTSVYITFDNFVYSLPVEVEEGTHRVVVKGSNIEPYSQEITVGEGMIADVDLSNVQYKSGFLIVKVNEGGYKLFINDEQVSANEPAALLFGEYSIKVEKDDFVTFEETVVIDSAEKTLNIELKKEVKSGKIIIITEPDGADVYINNTFVGKSPAEHTAEYGEHLVTIRKDGYITVQSTISLETQENKVYWTLMRLDTAMPTTVPASPIPTSSTNGF